MDDLDAALAGQPVTPPTFAGAAGRPAPKRAPDPTIARRNRNNRKRGKNTSRDLADYLGDDWQNVEGMGWPWDVQSPAARVQSKREALVRGPFALHALLAYMPAGHHLRLVYTVAPRARLTSGRVTALLKEWVEWYGWDLPANHRLSSATVDGQGVALVHMALPTFADYARHLTYEGMSRVLHNVTQEPATTGGPGSPVVQRP